MRLGGRKKCWIGAAIGAATSIAGSLFGNSAKKREMRRQQSIRDWQDATQEAANMTSVLIIVEIIKKIILDNLELLLDLVKLLELKVFILLMVEMLLRYPTTHTFYGAVLMKM